MGKIFVIVILIYGLAPGVKLMHYYAINRQKLRIRCVPRLIRCVARFHTAIYRLCLNYLKNITNNSTS